MAHRGLGDDHRATCLPVDEPDPLNLLFPVGGPPEAVCLRIGLDDDCLASHRAHNPQPFLGGGEELTSQPPTAVTGSDDEAIDRSTPAVPSRDHRADNASARL